MTETLQDDLRTQIAAGRVIGIIGAGVAKAATAGQAPDWKALLALGVERCAEVGNPRPRADWVASRKRDLEQGDLTDLLGVAEQVSARLGYPDGGEWKRWLRDTVGSLQPSDPAIIQALHELGVPLATTNYDGLIEQVTGLPPLTWQQSERALRVLRGEERAILHLHGHWDTVGSVVLGIRSYEEVLGTELAQTIQRAFAALHSVMFVGCGDTFGDPNFSALLGWMGQFLRGAEHRHFLLVRESERETQQGKFPSETRMFALGYGNEYGDLPGFLRSLAPATELPPPSVGLPVALPPKPRCFGRDQVIADLVTAILASEAPPIPILGPPGIGKTTITRVALHHPEIVKRFGARRWFVRLEGAKTAAAVLVECGRALGLEPGPNLAARLVVRLAEGPGLLVLDNVETPWWADRPATEAVLEQLAGSPGLVLLASIRGNARPHGPAWREPITVTRLTRDDSRRLFLAVAGAHFARDPRIEDLLGQLDDVPLAVELMAGVAEAEPDLDGVWRRWQTERTRVLTRPGGTDRLSNIAVSLELSITGGRMSDEARRLLSILGVLPDGIAHPDLEELMPGASAEAAGRLRQVGLAFDEAGRLRTLAPIRDHVAGTRTPIEEDRRQMQNHYITRAAELGGRAGGSEGREAIELLAAEPTNIEAMLLAGLNHSDPRPAIHAARAFSEFQRLSGVGTMATLEAAARAAQRIADPLGQANCIQGLGNIALARSDHDAARARYDQALPLYRQVGALLGQANCIQGLGNIALARSDHDAARARYDQALPLYRQVGDLLGQANCISRLGDIALDRSDHDAARARYDQALPLYRQVGALLGQANCISRLGDIALARSDHDAARARYDQALPLYRQVGDLLGQANCIKGLGDIALARSDHDTARARYDAALSLYRRVGALLGRAHCIMGLGDIARERSERAAAVQRYEEALALYERIPEPYSIGRAHLHLAQIASDPAAKARHIASARTAWTPIDRRDLLERLDAMFGADSQ